MAEGYPLAQLELIKKKRLEEAEKALAQKKRDLQKEEDLLISCEKERDKVKEHRVEKLTKLRESMDLGEPSEKITPQKVYLKSVEGELKKKEQKVKEQQLKVDKAKVAVEEARMLMIKRQHDMEKISEHKKSWQSEIKKEEERLDSIHADELGTVMHNIRKSKRKGE